MTWKSKKHDVAARSNVETEFKATTHGICKLLWLKIIMEYLGIEQEGNIKLYCDNKYEITIDHNPAQHDRTKQVEMDRHFIKEKLDCGLICTPYVSTNGQLADILTKGLSSHSFQQITSSLGMDNICILA